MESLLSSYSTSIFYFLSILFVSSKKPVRIFKTLTEVKLDHKMDRYQMKIMIKPQRVKRVIASGPYVHHF